jgi:hypothetical protein
MNTNNLDSRSVAAGEGAAAILARVRISEVYRRLGGPELRGNRGPAFWRGGDGLNVSMDDTRGVWHDFGGDGEGGGILDLVQLVLGGNRADALRWCAELAGVPLQDTPLSAADRERWARERRELDKSLPVARHWRIAPVGICDELLVELKAGLFDPTLPQPELGELAHLTGVIDHLRMLDGIALVTEYRSWLGTHPGITGALLDAGRRREATQRRAVELFVRGLGEAQESEVAQLSAEGREQWVRERTELETAPARVNGPQ